MPSQVRHSVPHDAFFGEKNGDKDELDRRLTG